MLQTREKPPPIKEMAPPIPMLKVCEFVKYSYSSATLGYGRGPGEKFAFADFIPPPISLSNAIRK
jgi:hypothetical protein